jgi:Na+-translocating ferredoxin:NAD+ oxidoreductase subunit G
MLRSAGLLGMVALLGTALLAGIHQLTKDRIEAQQKRAVLTQLNQVLPAHSYDNALHEDVVEILDPSWFRHPDPVRVYRARSEGDPVGVVLTVVAPDGYNGDIRLLVGILANGRISAVRVLEHRETPGLGDPIELRRSDWITGFSGRSLTDPLPAGWAVRRDGGQFDQFTGATITPRAVVEAVQRALTYFSRHRETLFEKPPMRSENNAEH